MTIGTTFSTLTLAAGHKAGESLNFRRLNPSHSGAGVLLLVGKQLFASISDRRGDVQASNFRRSRL